jgi:hypothetical protein
MKIGVLVGICFLYLVGCARDPVSTLRTDNNAVKVDKLFTHDGVTVYRFFDVGHHHYYAVKDNSSLLTFSDKQDSEYIIKEEIHTVVK